MKIAIVHEMLVKLGGAEKVVEKLLDIFPEADLYTLIYDQKKVSQVFPRKYGKNQVITSASKTQFIYDISFGRQRMCLPFMPAAAESLDLSKYDIVIVSSSAFAHGVITKAKTKTIIYYHSPARYLWDWTHEYRKDIGWDKGIKGYLLGKLFKSLREWDYIASQRKSVVLANSQNVASRIEKYYRKTAQVVYPPVEISRFQKDLPKRVWENTSKKYSLKSREYYIVLGALSEFKKVEIAIQGFLSMSENKLVIIGEGGLRKKLEMMINGAKNISLIGAQYDDTLVALVQNAKGLIFPGEEDFGIVPIEAMGAGIPVFAYKGGGLLESVREGVSGEFFEDKNGGDFIEKFRQFDGKVSQGVYREETVKQSVTRFDEKVFEENISKLVYDEN